MDIFYFIFQNHPYPRPFTPHNPNRYSPLPLSVPPLIVPPPPPTTSTPFLAISLWADNDGGGFCWNQQKMVMANHHCHWTPAAPVLLLAMVLELSSSPDSSTSFIDKRYLNPPRISYFTVIPRVCRQPKMRDLGLEPPPQAPFNGGTQPLLFGSGSGRRIWSWVAPR